MLQTQRTGHKKRRSFATYNLNLNPNFYIRTIKSAKVDESALSKFEGRKISYVLNHYDRPAHCSNKEVFMRTSNRDFSKMKQT